MGDDWCPFLHLGEERFLGHGPQRGDVVVCKPPFLSKDDLIKWVIGVPGDYMGMRDGRGIEIMLAVLGPGVIR